MKKIVFAFILSAAAALGVYAVPAEAQVQCQPGMDLIRYYSEYPGAPIEGIEVVYCDGHTSLIGRYKPFEDVQFCEMC